jgi:hypothetical protein
MAGQKILGAMLCSVTSFSWAVNNGSAEVNEPNNGAAINAKTHAEIGTIAYLSIIVVEDLGRPESNE